ncbi:MAG: SDR family oxidoreductase [Propionibacteriaceae bacterium]|nr:SDR family oxidoreductase [Propionibacteriaceae bacterium]
MGILSGRVAILTGASSGVGYGAAKRCAEEGATVIACARRLDRLESLAAETAAMEGRIVPQQCDVGVEADLDAAVARAIAEGGTVHALINIAQGGLDIQQPILDTTPDNALVFYRTGPIASLLLMQKCFPYMKEQGYGRIVNCASGAGVTGQAGFAGYAMAKGAILALTRTAAQEWGKFGIVSNVFLPVIRADSFDTSEQGKMAAKMVAQMSPVRKLGDPYEDGSPMVAFLASEGARYINAQTIAIDGGLTPTR